MIKQMANTSPGTDSCSAKMLKSLLPEGIETICKLYNYCLEGGTLPEKWKEGQITLIYKKVGHTHKHRPKLGKARKNNKSQILMETQTNKKQKTNNDSSSIHN